MKAYVVEREHLAQNIRAIRQKVGMVFQSFNLFPQYTVLENVTLAPVLEKKVPKDQAKEEAMALLEEAGYTVTIQQA